MSEFFLKIVNMSISASWLVAAVLAVRFAFQKAPKWITVLLWGVVALRLICPISFEAVFSLFQPLDLQVSQNTMTSVSPEIGFQRYPQVHLGIPGAS